MENTKTKRSFSIRSSLFISTLLLCIIPLIILSTIFINHSAKTTYKSFMTTATTLNNLSTNVIDEKLKSYEKTLDALSANEDFNLSLPSNVENLKSRFKTTIDSDDSLLNLYFATTDKKFVQALDDSLPDDYDPTASEWFQNAINAPDQFFHDEPYVDLLTNEMVFSVYHAVQKNNQTIGVMCLDILLSSVSPQIESLSFGKNGTLIVTDAEGTIIMNSDHAMIGSHEPTEYSTWNDISSNASGMTTFSYNGSKYYAVYQTCTLNGWKFIFRLPSSEIISEQSSMIFFSLLMLLLVAAIAIVLLFFLTKALCRPIFIIKEYIQRIAQGAFDQKVGLNTQILEFNILAEHLNVMQENISHILEEFSNSLVYLKNHASSFLDKSKQVSNALEKIDSNVSEISRGTSDSATHVEEINLNMDELSKNMDDIKTGSEKINDMAHQANLLGEDGKNISEDVKNISEQTKLSTTNVYEAIDQVAAKISDISIMSTTIRSITEQTNLLALNASIEAARAGEAGKGFAVVAGEIGKLADETAASAHKINDVVKNIESLVEKAVTEVSKTTSIVESQETAVNKSQVLFVDIITAIETLSLAVDTITNKLGNVNAMKNNVQEQVANLSCIIQESTTGAEEASNYAARVRSSSQVYVENASYLHTMADQLEEQMKHFKI